MEQNELLTELENVRDVCDFFIKWRQFRHLLTEDQLSQMTCSDEQKKCIEWMVLTMDRISILDLVESQEAPLFGDSTSYTKHS